MFPCLRIWSVSCTGRVGSTQDADGCSMVGFVQQRLLLDGPGYCRNQKCEKYSCMMFFVCLLDRTFVLQYTLIISNLMLLFRLEDDDSQRSDVTPEPNGATVAEVWIPESGEKAQRRTAGGPVTRMATDSALAEDFEGCRCKPSTFSPP